MWGSRKTSWVGPANKKKVLCHFWVRYFVQLSSSIKKMFFILFLLTLRWRRIRKVCFIPFINIALIRKRCFSILLGNYTFKTNFSRMKIWRPASFKTFSIIFDKKTDSKKIQTKVLQSGKWHSLWRHLTSITPQLPVIAFGLISGPALLGPSLLEI